MKRDPELFREIMKQVEEKDDGTPGWIKEIEYDKEKFTESHVYEHVRLLGEAGLMDVQDLSDRTGYVFLPKRLTNDGHDFLHAMENDTIWNKVKREAGKSLYNIPLIALKAKLYEYTGKDYTSFFQQ